MTTNDEQQSSPTERQNESPPTEQPPGQVAETKPFVYEGDQYPSYLQGKTPEEAAQLTQQLMDTLSTQVQQTEPYQQQSYQQQQVPQTPAGPDPDLLYSNPEQYHAQLMSALEGQFDQRLQTAAEQYVGPMWAQNAELSKEASQRNPKLKDVWDKYPHEIVKLVNDNLPVQGRTKDAWDMAAKVVMADHVDELAQARAERLASGSGTVTESVPGATLDAVPSQGDPIDRFWASDHPYVRRQRNRGVTKEELRNAARAMRLAPEHYVEMLKRDNVIYEGDNVVKRQGVA